MSAIRYPSFIFIFSNEENIFALHKIYFNRMILQDLDVISCAETFTNILERCFMKHFRNMKGFDGINTYI
jgi:hypothetical protein